MSGETPRFRLAYLGFFAYLGATGPYLTVFLDEGLGIDYARAGTLMALLTGCTLVGSFTAAWAADRWRVRRRLQRALSLAAVAACSAWLLLEDARIAPLVIALQGLAIGPQIPFLDAATVDALGTERRRYGAIRVWGTVAWGIAAAGVGVLREGVADPRLVPAVMVISLSVFHVATWRLPDSQPPAHSSRPRLDLGAALRCVPLLALLGACFVHGITFGNYEYFSARTFEDAGVTPAGVAAILVVGIVFEGIVFALSSRMLDRFGAPRLCLTALLVTAVRWLLMPWITGLAGFMALQVLHAFTFALWYAPALHLISHLVDREVRTSGQSLLFLALASGSALGAALGGHVRATEGMTVAFHGAAVVNVLGAGVLLMGWRRFATAAPVGGHTAPPA